MTYDTIRLEHRGDAAVITLDRPDRRNALNTRMRAEITHAIRAEGARSRAIVLTGAGESFCSGQDLGDAQAGVNLERTLRDEYEPMIAAVVDCPVPTIAAVNGAAAGAGANLALSCDIVIAAESAVFLQAFARIGLAPDAGGTWWLPRQVGSARAMGAAMLAEPIPAKTAAAWGMIWEAVPDDEFAARWTARADHLASGPTEAYRGIKRTLRESWANDLDAQLSLEAQVQGGLGKTRDFHEGVAAFVGKRAPRYEGR